MITYALYFLLFFVYFSISVLFAKGLPLSCESSNCEMTPFMFLEDFLTLRYGPKIHHSEFSQLIACQSCFHNLSGDSQPLALHFPFDGSWFVRREAHTKHLFGDFFFFFFLFYFIYLFIYFLYSNFGSENCMVFCQPLCINHLVNRMLLVCGRAQVRVFHQIQLCISDSESTVEQQYADLATIDCIIYLNGHSESSQLLLHSLKLAFFDRNRGFSFFIFSWFILAFYFNGFSMFLHHSAVFRQTKYF